MTPQEVFERASAIGGRLIYPEEGFVLQEAARRAGRDWPALIVEIGSYMGTSTAMLAAGAGPEGIVIAIDPHAGIADTTTNAVETENSSTIGPMRKTLWAVGVQHRVLIIPAYSADALPAVRALLPRPIDVLFVDGGHRYEDAIQDFRLYGPMVRKGGFLIADDLAYEGVGRAWEDFQRECAGWFIPVDLRPWGITDGVHKREFEGCIHKQRTFVRT